MTYWFSVNSFTSLSAYSSSKDWRLIINHYYWAEPWLTYLWTVNKVWLLASWSFTLAAFQSETLDKWNCKHFRRRNESELEGKTQDSFFHSFTRSHCFVPILPTYSTETNPLPFFGRASETLFLHLLAFTLPSLSRLNSRWNLKHLYNSVSQFHFLLLFYSLFILFLFLIRNSKSRLVKNESERTELLRLHLSIYSQGKAAEALTWLSLACKLHCLTLYRLKFLFIYSQSVR